MGLIGLISLISLIHFEEQMNLQTTRAEAFKALHERPGVFAIPNPWDAGSAKLLAGLGFEALATTSAGFAFSLGKPDGSGAVNREEALGHSRVIVEATSLPVSADLENGFGDEPETCAETIRLAAKAGLWIHRGRDRAHRGPYLSVRSVSGTGQSRSEGRARFGFPVYADRQSREFPSWTPRS
jgi:hypothetical protein